jgi:glycosyltransferase involved in cell wall biosynthesis
MNLLFVHQNFPGQFKHVVPALAAETGNRIVGFTMNKQPPRLPGVQMVSYQPARRNAKGVHPWVSDIESKVIRGEVAMKAARKMRDEFGFDPDLIYAHPGWGESLFLKEIWPRARLLLYCEWYYRVSGADMGFDAEFQESSIEADCRLKMKNAHNLLSLEEADAAVSPSEWQRSTFPAWFRDRIDVIHDGIDTRQIRRAAALSPLKLPIPADADCGIAPGEVELAPGDEIVSFVNRNLEPYRGYHIFLRALPELLRRRPRLKVVLVGGNETSYGAQPDKGTWKQRLLDEVRAGIDLARVHFVGKLPYGSFLRLLQLATVHTYLTYPFVLSWSLLEAMACEAAIVASDTEPVREVIADGETGRLVGFFDGAALVDRICELLDDPAQRLRLGRAARMAVVERYDLTTRCLPRQLALLRELAAR